VIDVVVDTNVWEHASHPRNALGREAKAFLERFLASRTELCVDDEFDLDPNMNRSRIVHEYLEQLHHDDFGGNALASLAAELRIKITKKRLPPEERMRLVAMLEDARDVTFAEIACVSDERVLVTHDGDDFNEAVCDVLWQRHRTEVMDAIGCIPRLDELE
jgi:hypothetical protein